MEVRVKMSKIVSISECSNLTLFAHSFLVLRFDKKRNHLKSLNDYYLMKCRLIDYIGFGKKRDAMPSFVVFFLISCIISFELALLLKFVAAW